MRIAVVVRSLKIGGMERVAVNLSEAFDKAGHESHLIYFKAKGKKLSPSGAVKEHYFDLERTLKKTGIGFLLFILAKLLNGIFRGTFFLYNGLLLAPIFKYKLQKLEKSCGKFDLIIIRGHGTFELIWPYKDDRVIQMVESVFLRDKTKLDKLYIKSVYEGKHLAGVSLGVKEKILEVTSKFKIKPASVDLIYNPIDVQNITRYADKYSPEIDTPYILSVGRVTPNKNIPFLLRSYAIAKERYQCTIPLVIIGDGHDMPQVKRTIKELHLQENVKLLGLLENPYPWMKQAALLTSTSKAEGFGMVIVESLICHTPVVTTKSRGGIRDIMVDELREYMVDFNEDAFACKIVQVSKERPHLEYEKYFKRFSSEVIVQEYLSYMQQKRVHSL